MHEIKIGLKDYFYKLNFVFDCINGLLNSMFYKTVAIYVLFNKKREYFVEQVDDFLNTSFNEFIRI